MSFTNCASIPSSEMVAPGAYPTPDNTTCVNPTQMQVCYNLAGLNKKALCMCAAQCRNTTITSPHITTWTSGTDCSTIPVSETVIPGQFVTPNHNTCKDPEAMQACYNAAGLNKKALCMCAAQCNPPSGLTILHWGLIVGGVILLFVIIAVIVSATRS